MMPLIPFVTNRVSSSARMPSASRRLQRRADRRGELEDLVADRVQTTLGWLKSFATSAATSFCHRSANIAEPSNDGLGPRPDVGQLVHHEHAVPVARVEHRAAHRVVRAAQGVEAGLLEQPHAAVLGGARS